MNLLPHDIPRWYVYTECGYNGYRQVNSLIEGNAVGRSSTYNNLVCLNSLYVEIDVNDVYYDIGNAIVCYDMVDNLYMKTYIVGIDNKLVVHLDISALNVNYRLGVKLFSNS